MAEMYNDQRVLGVRLVADGTLMYNGRRVVGISDAGDTVMFADNLRTLGVEIIETDQAIYNDQPVLGAVQISDGRKIYNGALVVPSSGGGGGGGTPPGAIGGMEIGSTNSIYSGNWVLAAGDDFDGALDTLHAGNKDARYVPVRTYQFDSSGHSSRYNELGGGIDLYMYDVDPNHTGFGDSNRGVAVPDWSDVMRIEDSNLVLKTRLATAQEKTFMRPGETRDLLGACLETNQSIILRPPFLMEWRWKITGNRQVWNGVDLSFPRGVHPTGWLKSADTLHTYQNWEIDWEGSARKLATRMYEKPVGSANADRAYTPVELTTAYDGNYHKMAISVTEDVPNSRWLARWYMDDVLVLENHTGLYSSQDYWNLQPGRVLFTNHITSDIELADWQDPGSADGVQMYVDWFRVFYPSGGGAVLTPLASQADILVASGATFDVTLPTAAALWGDATVDDRLESFMLEEHEPGGAADGGYGTVRGYLDGVPTGIAIKRGGDGSLNLYSGTRTGDPDTGTKALAAWTGKAGRLHFIRYATKKGYVCTPQKFSVDVGPKVVNAIALPDATLGVAYSHTIAYGDFECGTLVPASWSVTGLPAGLSSTVEPDGDLVISGTPTGSGTSAATITVRRTNSVGQYVESSDAISIVDPADDAPPVVSGLIVDFNPDDAATLTLTGALIDAIAGDSGTGYSATSSGALRPSTAIVGGKTGMHFSGAQELNFNAFAAAFPAAYTIVLIARNPAAYGATTAALLDVGKAAGISTRDRVLIYNGANGMTHRKAHATVNNDASQLAGAVGTANDNVMRCYFLDSASGSASARIMTDHTAVRAGSVITLAGGFDSATIGNRKSSSGNTYYTGDIMRVLIYNRQLTGDHTTGERKTIADWATTEYGTG